MNGNCPVAGTAARPRTFKQEQAEDEEREEHEEESENDSEEDSQKGKGTLCIIEIENPNLVKHKTVKAKEADLGRTTELSRREREEIEKQKARERYMRLQEQGRQSKLEKI
uniref:Casein kinase substrate phosphoprotein PP28 domain-containing protein n=1 Tax=Ananas comosus var. bracteatus TaxID=296719 RepID=A0A6V7PU89_ANACO|nr:unnamed protein product [Ananas comosus var. bracteatus]